MDPELERMARLCGELGAGPAQARAMAAQLLKRADQMADERGIARAEAMEYLLKVVVSGRRGEVYTGNVPGETGDRTKKHENPHNEAD